jgi:hypothetical protein
LSLRRLRVTTTDDLGQVLREARALLAPQNRRQTVVNSGARRRRQGGKGRPFARGNTIGQRFAEGQSGNPGGRPTIDAALRAVARELVCVLLTARITDLAEAGLLSQDRQTLRAFREALRRGGLASQEAVLLANVLERLS